MGAAHPNALSVDEALDSVQHRQTTRDRTGIPGAAEAGDENALQVHRFADRCVAQIDLVVNDRRIAAHGDANTDRGGSLTPGSGEMPLEHRVRFGKAACQELVAGAAQVHQRDHQHGSLLQVVLKFNRAVSAAIAGELLDDDAGCGVPQLAQTAPALRQEGLALCLRNAAHSEGVVVVGRKICDEDCEVHGVLLYGRLPHRSQGRSGHRDDRSSRGHCNEPALMHANIFKNQIVVYLTTTVVGHGRLLVRGSKGARKARTPPAGRCVNGQ